MADRIPVITGGNRYGKTILMERMLSEATRANPSLVVIRMAANGDHRIEKPVTAADLVPELRPCDGDGNALAHLEGSPCC